MIRLTISVLLCAALTALAQSPAARLAVPVNPNAVLTRGAEPDPFMDGPRLPAARLGVITSARIGEVPADASPEERYNWGAPRSGSTRARPASRSRERDYDRGPAYDDYDNGGGARLRDPVTGRLTRGGKGGRVEPVPAGAGPAWWPEREQDLADLRDSLPAFGDERGDADRLAFQSDCAFDDFISPITNPFLAEDPRSLTELRPLFIYQTIPSSHPFYQGGSIAFLGVQGRAALTERFSVVVHKLGWIRINSGETSPVPSNTGFSEIWLSPKFTFWRDPDRQVLASFGLQFQLPTGPGTVYQDTGTLSLVPYLSYARELGSITAGTFRMINVAGYSFSSGGGRSDYFFDTLHLDLDVGDLHRFYPTLEATWFHHTTNGGARPFLPFEGRDLANIGGSAAGRDFVSLAPGFRYKFSDYVQFGAAAEFPIIGPRDLHQFRLTVDMIWRY